MYNASSLRRASGDTTRSVGFALGPEARTQGFYLVRARATSLRRCVHTSSPQASRSHMAHTINYSMAKFDSIVTTIRTNFPFITRPIPCAHESDDGGPSHHPLPISFEVQLHRSRLLVRLSACGRCLAVRHRWMAPARLGPAGPSPTQGRSLRGLHRFRRGEPAQRRTNSEPARQ